MGHGTRLRDFRFNDKGVRVRCSGRVALRLGVGAKAGLAGARCARPSSLRFGRLVRGRNPPLRRRAGGRDEDTRDRHQGADCHAVDLILLGQQAGAQHPGCDNASQGDGRSEKPAGRMADRGIFLARPRLRPPSGGRRNRYRYRNRNIPREIRLRSRSRSRFRVGRRIMHRKNLTHL